jgi:membrane protease YdiL (CAAX protease family)
MPTAPDEILPSWPVALGCVLGYLAVAPVAWVAFRRLLPRARQRVVPWNSAEVVAVFLLSYLCLILVAQMIVSSGLAGRFYGRDSLSELLKDDTAQMRLGLLTAALAAPLQVASILGFLYMISGTRPYQVSVTTNRIGRNALLGVLGCVLLAPVVEGLFLLVEWLLLHLEPGGLTDHPFTELAQKNALAPVERFLLLPLAAVVAAPVVEELLFRGVVQRWARGRWWGGHATMGGAAALVLYGRSEAISKLMDAGGTPGWSALLEALAPALFVLALVPIFLWVFRASRTPFGPALFGTSLLFAAVHSSVWPSPVALFVLALGLGWLAERTQSLVGPIVLHGLFNGIACVQLIWFT